MYNAMIVEDDVMYRYALRTSVEWEKEGFRLCGEAINGKHALDRLHECHPDLIITDINMPEMNGLDLIAALRQLNPDLYIVVLSSYDDFPFVRQALKSGAKDYFLKHETEPSEIVRILREFRQLRERSEDGRSGPALPGLDADDCRQPEIRQIIAYIREHYREQITLQQLADHLYLSPNYLCNLFKQGTGMTIFEYIKRFRIEVVKHLLETTPLRVYEIAEQTGFNNSSYLCRVFKESTGISINDYKRGVKGGGLPAAQAKAGG
jgi:two-component system response regulator YesN